MSMTGGGALETRSTWMWVCDVYSMHDASVWLQSEGKGGKVHVPAPRAGQVTVTLKP